MQIKTREEIIFVNKLLRIYKKTIERNKKDAFYKIMSNSYNYDTLFKGQDRDQFVELHALGLEKFGGIFMSNEIKRDDYNSVRDYQNAVLEKLTKEIKEINEEA